MLKKDTLLPFNPIEKVCKRAPALFTSQNQKWRTPKALYRRLDHEFHFDFDPCPVNPTFNGLFIAWGKRNFVNPPYNETEKWVRKAWLESLKGKLCVVLLASRTDTKWFHKYALPYAKEIRFVKGRITFYDGTPNRSVAPFPSVIIIFGDKTVADKNSESEKHE